MNPSMYLVAVLAFCALPSALGLTCHACVSNATAGNLCTNMSHYTTETCMGNNTQCAITEVMTNISVPVPVPAYILGCVNYPANCSTYQMALCQNVTVGVNAQGLGVTKCNTTCCSTNNCNMLHSEASTAASTPTATGTDAGTKAPTTAAADVFRPYLLALLFIVLAVVGTQ